MKAGRAAAAAAAVIVTVALGTAVGRGQGCAVASVGSPPVAGRQSPHSVWAPSQLATHHMRFVLPLPRLTGGDSCR